MGTLSTLNVAITGKLPADPSTIKRWLGANGARYSPTVTKGVTHLVTTKEAWKAVTDPVLKAANLSIPIVSYDWLEDSLQKRRRLSEKKYTFEALQEGRKKRRELKKLGVVADSKKFMEGCAMIRRLTGSGTSKVSSTRKNKSNSFFFADVLNTPFASAADDLQRRRAEREKREAVEAAKKAEKVAKKNGVDGTKEKPIEIVDDQSMESAHTTVSPKTVPADSNQSTSTLKLRTPQKINPLSQISDIKAKPQSLKDLYHYYVDSTGFEYKVILVRSNFALNSITIYQLSLLESHTIPHTYCTLVQYKPPNTSPQTQAKGAIPAPNSRNHLLSFLNCNKSTTTSPSTNDHPEAIRLRGLISKPTPTSKTPYKSLICPMNSAFAPAWRAFRHAFRDLTLLTWEERLDDSKTVQKSRAVILNIEPFVYSRPMPGLPNGMMPQVQRLFQGGGMVHKDSEGVRIVMPSDGEDGYVRNEFGLPGLDVELGDQGVVGAAIKRDREMKRKREEEAVRKREEAERKRRETERAARRIGGDGVGAGSSTVGSEAYARYVASGGQRGFMLRDMDSGGRSHWGWRGE